MNVCMLSYPCMSAPLFAMATTPRCRCLILFADGFGKNRSA